MKPDQIPPAYLHECFAYAPETGEIVWKHRPRHHFSRAADHLSFNKRFAGNPAGVSNHGYLRIALTYQRRCIHVYAHRVALCLMHGQWPTARVDHKDLDGLNNRASNLRPATVSENGSNCGPRAHNRLGIKGVQQQGNRFSARITLNRQSVHLGTFATAREASDAFMAASINARGEFARAEGLNT